MTTEQRAYVVRLVDELRHRSPQFIAQTFGLPIALVHQLIEELEREDRRL